MGKDYQVLAGTHRATVTATAWLQEAKNLKTVLRQERALDLSRPYLAREYGVARHERLRDGNLAAAEQYCDRTRRFCDDVPAA